MQRVADASSLEPPGEGGGRLELKSVQALGRVRVAADLVERDDRLVKGVGESEGGVDRRVVVAPEGVPQPAQDERGVRVRGPVGDRAGAQLEYF